jgi:transposase-like protein
VRLKSLKEDRLCLLVMIGVRPAGTKELLALEDGNRESTESWASLRRSQARAMQAPVLAVGDSALGFWAAVGEAWPETREQRGWVHKLSNVLGKLSKRLQARSKEALHDVMYAVSTRMSRGRSPSSPTPTAPSTPRRSSA